MKNFSMITICFFLLISCEQPQKDVVKFQDKNGRFKISFSVKPTITEQSGETVYGKTTTYSFKAEPKNDDNISYEIHYVDYPESFADTLSIESIYAVFNGSQTTNMNSDDIELIGNFNHNILGYIGREFRWKYVNLQKLSRVRFYMVNNRMYILSVNTKEENNFNLGINQFFESFELINTAPNAKEQVLSKKSEKIYKIKFPQSTEVREVETQTEYGNAKVIAELYQPNTEDDDNVIYMSSSLEYPKDITQMDNFNLKEYYTNFIAAAMNARQSTLISQKEISKDDIVGVEVKESFQEGQIFVKQQMFLKGNTLISIQVMTAPYRYGNKSMNTFFDSFEFINN